MADSATTRNRFRKPESGQYVNAWAPELNEDFGSDRLDQALDGVLAFTLSGSKTLTSTNYETDEARMRQIHITGGTGGTVTIPAVEKFYMVRNSATGTVTFTCGGVTASIAAGSNGFILCNGTNCYGPTSSADAAAAAASAAAALVSEDNAETAEANAETAQTAAEGAQAAAEAAQAAAEAAAASAGGIWTQLATATPTVTGTLDFTAIPGTFQDLLIVVEGISHNNGANQTLALGVSSDNSNYSTGVTILGSSAASVTVYGSIFLPGYRKGHGLAASSLANLTSAPSAASAGVTVAYRLGAALTAIRLAWSAGNYDAGTVTVFGR